MSNRRSVGVVYNPSIPGTEELVAQLVKRLDLREGALVCSVEELEGKGQGHPGVDLLLTVGGDGTILRAVHIAAPHSVAILGINMGRVGFMTELRAQDAVENLDRYLDNDAWIEERAMLQAQVVPSPGWEGAGREFGEGPLLCHALNEAVVGSSAAYHMTRIGVAVDCASLTVYRADAVIVATATGSTGFALSAGGPIIHPLSRDILLQPFAPYLGLGSALVLPSTSRIQLTVMADNPAVLRVDGFVDVALGEGDRVLVEASPYVARFLRAQPPSHYYATLRQRLGLGHDDTTPRAIF